MQRLFLIMHQGTGTGTGTRVVKIMPYQSEAERLAEWWKTLYNSHSQPNNYWVENEKGKIIWQSSDTRIPGHRGEKIK